MRRTRSRTGAFALYEVMIGVAIFVVGVLSLGRSAENCMNAVTLSAQEDRVRQILSNRMAEVQATPGAPDAKWEKKLDTGYGALTLVQRSVPAEMKDEKDFAVGGIHRVTLTAEWSGRGAPQSRRLEFYVYRAG